jgi:hypothetical protein
MAYFKDQTFYSYTKDGAIWGLQNVGWLDADHPFETKEPSEEFLDALWQFCHVAAEPARGGHSCEICKHKNFHKEDRHGESLYLGGAQIRVFTTSGNMYAAPNLIYHYVRKHQYDPPDDFIDGVLTGLRPPDPRYFERLEELGIPWFGAPRWSSPVRFVRSSELPTDWVRVIVPDEECETP